MSRIAIDIDSTLHHYWDLLDRIARDRYGVELPYAEQRTWGITSLEHEELVECIRETHTEENILGAEPYPDAVETIRDWHANGHWIHITSHRAEHTCEATARWLDQIGLPYDDLHCSYDKVTRCVELGIHVLIDGLAGQPHEGARRGDPGRHADPPLERGADRPAPDRRRRRLVRPEEQAPAEAGPGRLS